MNRLLVCLLVPWILIGCRSAAPPDAPEDAHLEAIRPGVWMHTTYREVEGFGFVRSNGLVVASDREALLVDAGWDGDPEGVTAMLLEEIRAAAGVPVQQAVVSHHHEDSVAGIGALRRAGVPVFGTSETAELMDAAGWGRPDSLFDAQADAWTLDVGGRAVEVFYAGPGHTVDNVVVYVPDARVLYTGCLVRPGGTSSLGNTADADLDRWAESVSRVRARYGDRVEVVVPSHGPPGGADLLDHTIRLVEEQRGRPVGG